MVRPSLHHHTSFLLLEADATRITQVPAVFRVAGWVAGRVAWSLWNPMVKPSLHHHTSFPLLEADATRITLGHGRKPGFLLVPGIPGSGN